MRIYGFQVFTRFLNDIDNSNNEMTDKNVVVGLDCCDPDLVYNWSRQYNLEGFKSLMREGFLSTLQSTVPPVTIPAWISMFSGKNPGRIGAFGLMRLTREYTLKPYSSHQWRGDMLWDIAGRQGKTTGVAFLPFYYPSYPVDGFMISDPPSSREWVYPPELGTDIGENPASQYAVTEFQHYKNMFEKKKDIFWKVMDKSADILVLGVEFLDKVVHMNSTSTLKKAYRIVDRFLSAVYNVCSDRGWNLIVVSDHGCKEIDTIFNFNVFLEHCGVLTHKKRPKSQMIFQDFVLEKLPEKIVHPLLRKKSSDALLPNVVFSETSAFAHDCGGTSSFGGVWMNREDTFSDGVLSSEAAEKMEKTVFREFCNIRYNAAMYKTRKVYPQVQTVFPDLIFQLKNRCIPFFCPSRHLFYTRNMYAHRRTGTLMAAGPDISKKAPTRCKVIDIMPTLMHGLGCDIPSTIDGKVLDIFKKDSLPGKTEVSYFDVEETEKIKTAVSHMKAD
jgi:predicted AlkP superfamily phosphohydrolase/phosphomutase